MRHRIFIAINLPESLKKKLWDFRLKWPDLPCRWTKKENLHITLAFLGYLSEEDLLEICKITKEVAIKHEPFFINLSKIIYGPPGRPIRMVWAEGEKSEELGKLQGSLENALASSEASAKEDSKSRPYAPHITLGRIKTWEFRQMEPEEKPEIDEEIPPAGGLSFEVKSIDVMESQLKKSGPEYTILESCQLKS